MFENKTRVFVINSSAIFTGYVSQFTLPLYTTPQVISEIKDEKSLTVLETIKITGKLIIKTPSRKSLEKITKLSKDIGEFQSLSNTDLSILALALDLQLEGKKPVIVTDDYAIQNVAKNLGLDFQPIRTRGIEEARKYIIVCPACGYVAKKDIEKYCPKCGHKLIKKRTRTS